MNDRWPDDKLERQMLADADYLTERLYDTAAQNAACHIRALLARVRELESQIEKINGWLADGISEQRRLCDEILGLRAELGLAIAAMSAGKGKQP